VRNVVKRSTTRRNPSAGTFFLDAQLNR